ncbi:MAG: FeS assembly SUF system protein [Bacteroidetes bacterium RIFCSPLOWO2_02_FULL_36_8]|nr:MAG: FeS assembly SUF system protein [Bacteroidetes bacterium RIFCSPLOWO2_02_FULL_36_8]OFY71530.1 MAG: FeS assembly SUF system protein [Bacteroidetes bacterium RIFCSPLOWO2_12_FULL_37_12]
METSNTSEIQTLTKEDVIGILKTCYDPEIPVDIWELGLIYEIQLFPINNIYVRMTLTSPACPVAGVLPGQVENKIKSLPGAGTVSVELVFDPTWHKDMMSEKAKLELGFM